MYYYLRAKQLRYLLKNGHRWAVRRGLCPQQLCCSQPHAACAHPSPPSPFPSHPLSDAAELWRPFSQCDYRSARLLRQRSRAPLAVHVPAAMTGIDDGSPGAGSVRLLGQVVVAFPCPRPSRVATTAAALAAAKMRSAAALAAAHALLPQRAEDRRPPLSPSTSSGSLSQASSGSLDSFSGSLRSLARQGESSPTPGASASGWSGGASAGPVTRTRPPLPRQARFVVRELPTAPLQRFDTLSWQPPLAAAAAAAAMAQAHMQQLKAGTGGGAAAAQAALSHQPWGPHAQLAAHVHVAVP